MPDFLNKTKINIQIKGTEKCVKRRNVRINYIREEERINEIRRGETK